MQRVWKRRRCKPQSKRRSAPIGVVERDIAAEQACKPAADGEPEAVSTSIAAISVGVAKAEKFLKDFFVQVAWNTGAGIPNFDSDDFAALRCLLCVDDGRVDSTALRAAVVFFQ